MVKRATSFLTKNYLAREYLLLTGKEEALEVHKDLYRTWYLILTNSSERDIERQTRP